VFVFCGLALVACGRADPLPNNNDTTDKAVSGAPCPVPVEYTENLHGCAPLASDYRPREQRSAYDAWAPCISDDGEYHRIAADVSSIARVAAFEQIGKLLFRFETPGVGPTHTDFVDARVLFEEDQGLGSRIARRFDPHYPAPTSGKCEEAGVSLANPDYCVGPTKLQPLIVSAFADGALGNNRLVNAKRIEAALLWFFYVSQIKEATTCTTTAQDCDSSWAYFTGGGDLANPLGLAKRVQAMGPETYARTHDGELAVRCWRDLDQAVPATNLALRDSAILQLDRAALRGIALLVRREVAIVGCATGDFQTASLEALRVLIPLLDRAARERDPAAADVLAAEVAKPAASLNVSAMLAAIDSTFRCP
jgi:hypothetical protein